MKRHGDLVLKLVAGRRVARRAEHDPGILVAGFIRSAAACVGGAQCGLDPAAEGKRHAFTAQQRAWRVGRKEASDEGGPVERNAERRPSFAFGRCEVPIAAELGRRPVFAQCRAAQLAARRLFGTIGVVAIVGLVVVVIEAVVAEELDAATVDPSVRRRQVTVGCVQPGAAPKRDEHGDDECALHCRAPIGRRTDA